MEHTMIYRTMDKTGEALSVLGYGCMRFPRKNGLIDEKRTREQILLAIERGVNYFDTAYLYPGSEKMLGKILADAGVRENVKIATKLPPMLIKNRSDMNNIFEKQLKSLQTDYIDYYLTHNIATFTDWQRLKELGVLSFVEEEKKRGRIRHFGFSFHGNLVSFKQMLDDFDWDFCQIQYNYLDENFQAGTEGLKYAGEKGVGVIIMEPLRGGLLGNQMPEAPEKILRQCLPDRNPAEWALRWVLSHPEVSVVLSGMNEEAHIEENALVASSADGFIWSEEEKDCLEKVKDIFHAKIKVPCTGCAYCMPCPHGVDIPTCFSWYNNQSIRGGVFSMVQYIQAMDGVINGKVSKASLCKNCGACVKHCPQQIDIPARLKDTADKMEKSYIRIPLRLALKIANKFI